MYHFPRLLFCLAPFYGTWFYEIGKFLISWVMFFDLFFNVVSLMKFYKTGKISRLRHVFDCQWQYVSAPKNIYWLIKFCLRHNLQRNFCVLNFQDFECFYVACILSNMFELHKILKAVVHSYHQICNVLCQ